MKLLNQHGKQKHTQANTLNVNICRILNQEIRVNFNVNNIKTKYTHTQTHILQNTYQKHNGVCFHRRKLASLNYLIIEHTNKHQLKLHENGRRAENCTLFGFHNG